ncbi:hypothetical protein [Geodermatophilus maliterrae]|uniref:Uncharacterized protein n=1 Tax=Geodermatophilus maliterrae TaxID=3162531 RepID=A0ABV3XBB0_9ACTN
MTVTPITTDDNSLRAPVAPAEVEAPVVIDRFDQWAHSGPGVVTYCYCWIDSVTTAG